MNKILAFGDAHISSYHQFSKIQQTGFSIRESEHLMVAKQIVEYMKKYEGELKAVVFLGDLLHPVGTNISCDNLLTATEFIRIIQEECIRQGIIFYLLVGNHDQNATTGNVHSHKLIPYKYYQNVRVIDQLSEIDGFVFLPHVTNNESYIDNYLKSITNKEDKIVFSHLDIRGATLFGEIVCDKGIKFDSLADFKVVLQGHFHVPQKLGSNVWVSGSTHRTSFKDPGGGTLLVYDMDSNKVTREKFNVPNWYTFEDDNIEDILTLDPDNYVKLILSSDLMLSIHNISKEWLTSRFKGVEIMYDVERISSKKLKRSEQDLEVETPEEIIRSFINSSPNIEAANKEDLIQTGLDLISRVKR